MKLPNHAVKYTLAVLLLASLTTTQILSTAFAKYTTSSTTPTETARVAKYAVKVIPVDKEQDGVALPNEEVSDVELDAADGNGKTASVTQYYKVINESEVAVSYQVVVTLDKALPTGTSIWLADNYGPKITLAETDESARIKVEKAETTKNEKTEISFTCSSEDWTLAPGANDDPHSVALTFITDNTNNAAVSDLDGIGVTVEVIATQID